MRYKYIFSREPGVSDPVLLHAQNSVHAFFLDLKTDRTFLATSASMILERDLHNARQAQTPLAQQTARRNALKTYEASHLAIGDMPLVRLIAAIHNLPHFPAGCQLTLKPDYPGYELHARPGPWAVEKRIGKVYAGDTRFTLANVHNTLNAVYHRIDQPNRQYVQLPDGSFLRRFITRGLNQDDSERLRRGQGLLAAHPNANRNDKEISRYGYGPDGPGEAIVKDVLSHTRGWQKRYISTTTTKRAVHSTQGKEFRSVFGAVLIDLANVALASVVDLHRPDRLPSYFNITAPTVVAPRPPGNGAALTLDDERYLAARDVIRTREVLIRDSVPQNAVRSGPAKLCVLDVYSPNTPTLDSVVAHIKGSEGLSLEDEEKLAYPWMGYRHWFLAYPTEAIARLAWIMVRQFINTHALPRPMAFVGAELRYQYCLPVPPPPGA
ncbi:hypothetical protein [Cupriavidus necator]|uniref:hypothetical protein n=1 Tax=Cupriavidus necator TaxID=106590 RepID=UPI000F501AD4|nr:hypothetical protein [Cupriavidus necator]